MRVACSHHYFLLTWGGALFIFGEPEKAGVLATSWSSWLFHFTVQALWNHQALLGPGKMLFEVNPVGVQEKSQKKTNIHICINMSALLIPRLGWHLLAPQKGHKLL